jgi:hypothetical protein
VMMSWVESRTVFLSITVMQFSLFFLSIVTRLFHRAAENYHLPHSTLSAVNPLQLTKSMEQNSSVKVDGSSCNKELSRILCNPKLHCLFFFFTEAWRTSLPWASSIKYTSPILLKIYFNIILLYTRLYFR